MSSLLDRARELWQAAHPVSGWLFCDARFLAVRVEVDPEKVRAGLPAGLEATDQATLFVAEFPQNATIGSAYNEAGLFLHVRRGREQGLHCPWMVVDDDIALITGRDLLGYPKKLAQISINWSPHAVSARVERKGEPVFELRAALGDDDAHPPPMEALPTWNVMGTIGVSLQRLVKFQASEEVLQARRAQASVNVHRASRDPISEFGFGAVHSAHYYRLNLGGAALPWPVRPLSPSYWVHNWSLRCG